MRSSKSATGAVRIADVGPIGMGSQLHRVMSTLPFTFYFAEYDSQSRNESQRFCLWSYGQSASRINLFWITNLSSCHSYSKAYIDFLWRPSEIDSILCHWRLFSGANIHVAQIQSQFYSL